MYANGFVIKLSKIVDVAPNQIEFRYIFTCAERKFMYEVSKRILIFELK